MKKTFRKLAVLAVFMALPFFFVQCDNSKEKTGGKEGEGQQQQAVGQKENQPQPKSQAKNQPKAMLPERLLNLGLTDTQRAQCEAAHQEIFTPDVIAQRSEMFKKLRGMEKDSAEYTNFQNEIREKFKPYNVQFNKKLRQILTPEQQDKYFAFK